MAFFVIFLQFDWLLKNLIGCFVLEFFSQWLGKKCDLEQKIVRFVNKITLTRASHGCNFQDAIIVDFVTTNLWRSEGLNVSLQVLKR